MKKKLTACEIERRKFWKFVCREGLYLPSVKIEKRLVYDCDKYDLINRSARDRPIFEKTSETINGYPALLATGYFRMPTKGNPCCDTTSKYGIVQYHWTSSAFKCFNARLHLGLESGVMARLKKRREKEFKERATRHKEQMQFERQAIRNLNFAYRIYDEARDAGVKNGLISPRQADLALIEAGRFSDINPSKQKQAYQSVMNFLHYIQINNILRLLRRRQ